MTMILTPKMLLKYLTVAILSLLLLNVIAIFLKFNFSGFFSLAVFKLFDFDTEANIPTLYSTITLLFCSFLLFYIHFVECRWSRFLGHWSIMAIVFFYLALDENFSIHESSMIFIRESLHLSGLLYYSWIVPYGLAIFVMGIFFTPFLLKLPRTILSSFFLAFVLFVGGAVGMEMVAGRHYELYGKANYIFSIYYSFEELLEMFGVAIFIYGLLSYISLYSKTRYLEIIIRPDKYPQRDLQKKESNI